MLLAGVSAGGVLHAMREHRLDHVHIGKWATPEGRIVRVIGEVAGAPRTGFQTDAAIPSWNTHRDQTSLVVRARNIKTSDGWTGIGGQLRVTIREPVLDLAVGDRVELFGRLYSLRTPRNPGEFDWRSYLRREGISARLACDHRENVRQLNSDIRHPWVFQLRRAVTRLMTDDLGGVGPDEASLLTAMVLGQRSDMDRRLNDLFIRAGCSHFIAVSGVNVAIVMLIVRAAGRVLLMGRRRQLWLAIAAVILYAVIVEPRPSVLRATVIALTYCTACLMGREEARLNWICATILILGLLDPSVIFDPGFQLSNAAVMGIVYLGPVMVGGVLSVVGERVRWLGAPLAGGTGPPGSALSGMIGGMTTSAARGVAGWSLRAMAASAAAWALTWPIIALWFFRIQPWGAVASVVVTPMVALVMALGFARVVAAAVFPAAADAIGALLAWSDLVLIDMVGLFARVPYSSPLITPPPAWFLVFYYMGWWLVAWGGSRSRERAIENEVANSPPVDDVRGKWMRRTAMGGLGTVVLALVIWGWWPKERGSLRVTFLAVGAGSATVLDLPDGSVVVFDAGSQTIADAGRDIVAPFLLSRGIHRVHRLHVSHANTDHYNGVPSLVETMPVDEVVLNRWFLDGAAKGGSARRLVEFLALAGKAPRALDERATTWHFGEAEFELLYPLDVDRPTTTNDASTVMRVSHAGRSVLLTGDIEDYALGALLLRGDLRADALALPHHGAVRPATADFIRAVNPGVLIRSSHETRAGTTNNLMEIVKGLPLWSTADDGAVEWSVSQRGEVSIQSFMERR